MDITRCWGTTTITLLDFWYSAAYKASSGMTTADLPDPITAGMITLSLGLPKLSIAMRAVAIWLSLTHFPVAASNRTRA